MIDSRESRLFLEIEYNILKFISENKSKLCYVIIHSTNTTDQNEKIEMINNGLKSVIDKYSNKNDNNDFFNKIKANKNNTVVVNFHPFNGYPIYGLKQLLLKIAKLAE